MTGSGHQGDIWQTGEWQGRVGDAWAREWQRTDRSFADLSRQLNEAILAAAPDSGRAIDLGCGAGQTSIALATARPDLEVTGVDLSEDLIAVARERGKDIANLSFRAGNTAELDPATAADFFVSRHGVMFFEDPVAAFTAIRRAATSGAGLVFSCFAARARNQWVQVLDSATNAAVPVPTGYTPGPFGFADRALTTGLLADAGWVDATPQAVDFTYVAGAGDSPVEDARQFFSHIGPAARVLADASPDSRAILFDRLAKALADYESDGQVTFPAAAWIWTARAGEAA